MRGGSCAPGTILVLLCLLTNLPNASIGQLRALKQRELSAKITQLVRDTGLEPKLEATEPNIRLKTIPRSRDFHYPHLTL